MRTENKIVYYKSEDGLSSLEMAAYFWNERGDIERHASIESTYVRIPELEQKRAEMLKKIEQAEIEFVAYLQKLVDEHDPKDWGN